MTISLPRERELAFKQVREAEDVTIMKTKETSTEKERDKGGEKEKQEMGKVILSSTNHVI